MYYDTINKTLHNDRSSLPAARGQTNGLQAAPDDLLATLGIIPCVTDPVPDGMAPTGEYTITITDGIAHRTPVCIPQAEADAHELAAESARIAALLPMWGAHVARLNTMLAQIGMAIPTNREAVTTRILELLDGGNATIGVLGLLLDKQYEILAPVQNDVEAIWLAVQAMQGGE